MVIWRDTLCINISIARLDKQVKTLHKSHVRSYFANKLTFLKNMHWGFSAMFRLRVCIWIGLCSRKIIQELAFLQHVSVSPLVHCIFSCVVLGKLFSKVFFINKIWVEVLSFLHYTYWEIHKNNTPYVVCLIGGAIVTVLKTRPLSKPFPDLSLQLSSIFKS